ncbi:MAG: M15 family metallopeptidase [Oscillospiraceae bacterium]|nr:M15 family metallopeptidase [Oscillospiraceae bacterium]
MNKNLACKGLLILACILLLCVISARVGQSGADGLEDISIVMPDDAVTLTEMPEPTPESTPEPTPEPYADKPDADVYSWELRLVNNTHVLTGSFTPDEVVEVRDGAYFDSRAADALESMLLGAEEAGYTVYVKEGYRPYTSQATMFFGRASIIALDPDIPYEEAETLARSIVAYPGTSDHQTGLAADIVDDYSTSLDSEALGDLPVLLWLQENCAQYGFIYRYPEDKKDITGWYEPWHFRYVGVEAAEYMMENNLCLEEFIALY